MNKKHIHNDEGIYRLHIDFVPPKPAQSHSNEIKPAPKQEPQHKAEKKSVFNLVFDKIPRRKEILKKKEPQPKAKNAKVWIFIKDKLQFVLVSAVVFFVIYAVLNWQALMINAVYFWNKWRGFQSPLERLVIERPREPERLIAPPAFGSSQTAIPPLNIEVYPTDMRIIIPRINQNVPVVGAKNENLIARKWDELEADIQQSLRSGVVHYPGTALPGDNGNVVITGHSSYYAWDPGRFKDVFALLHDVRMGDRIVVYFNQKKFVYEVNNIKVVLPKDVDVLGPTNFEQLTLITCTPIGTNLKRLIVTARLVQKN